MIFTRHTAHRLAAYIDGELNPAQTEKTARHVAQCVNCQSKFEQIRFGMEALDHLPSVDPPDAIWTAIEAAYQANLQPARVRYLRWALTAVAALVLVGVGLWFTVNHSRTQWKVSPVSGSPLVNQAHLRSEGRVGAGEWIETDSRSIARVEVGNIGSVEVEPGTRLRIVTAQPGEHRLALAQGEIRAKISAPPRLFFVDTPSGTAVDLGCEYTLDADAEGADLLQVTKGWVSLQWKGMESLVPAGASCRTQPHLGPGVPYFEDAPENLKRALQNFGLQKTGAVELNVILSEARMRDTLSLWHLLSRVDMADRERVYDRIASLTPVPPGVSRDQALKLDPETLQRWKDELAWTW
jgi:anti-sigma factor RsiW